MHIDILDCATVRVLGGRVGEEKSKVRQHPRTDTHQISHTRGGDIVTVSLLNTNIYQ